VYGGTMVTMAVALQGPAACGHAERFRPSDSAISALETSWVVPPATPEAGDSGQVLESSARLKSPPWQGGDGSELELGLGFPGNDLPAKLRRHVRCGAQIVHPLPRRHAAGEQVPS
jgi:hypothetical protein